MRTDCFGSHHYMSVGGDLLEKWPSGTGLLVESDLLLWPSGVTPPTTLKKNMGLERKWHLTPHEQTNRCKNITFPQLRWRMVIKIDFNVKCEQSFSEESVDVDDKCEQGFTSFSCSCCWALDHRHVIFHIRPRLLFLAFPFQFRFERSAPHNMYWFVRVSLFIYLRSA